MMIGSIRSIQWGDDSLSPFMEGTLGLAETEAPTPAPGPSETRLGPRPASAADEAKLLLRIAGEVEGALLVQYLYAAYSILPNVVVTPDGATNTIVSDDWYNAIRDIARQEMGHLITVQNLLLSLNAAPHLDRENFPIESDLYPFPFELRAFGNDTLAKSVAAEAPRVIRAGDQADYQAALSAAKIAVGAPVSRVGQIYERLYFLFQDTDAPQDPWTSLVNPFPGWPNWHVDKSLVGFNQDRQAQAAEWRGSDASSPPDSAVYVLPIADKAAARLAIYLVSLQGEGPIDGQVEGLTHFDKFLRVFREYQLYQTLNPPPPTALKQVVNPSTNPGAPGYITNPAALAWAKLSNIRYEVLLLNIALSLCTGSSGSVPGTVAARRDFVGWAFIEMLTSIKKLGEELRTMPIQAGPSDSLFCGLPFELPSRRDLPVTIPEQVAALRAALADSQAVRQNIRDNYNPVPRQQTLLTTLGNLDHAILTRIGTGV